MHANDLKMNEEELVRAAAGIPGRCWPEELAFLHQLALTAPPGLPMVELGTFQGRTAAILCAVAQETGSEVVTIDNYIHDGAFTGNYKALANDPDYGQSPEKYAQLTRENLAKLGFQARVIVGDSAVVPQGIEEVGLLFIDSEHARERFNAECDAWLPLIVKGGILACHDYKQPDWPVMTPAIDDRIGENEWERLGLVNWLVAFRKNGRDTMIEEKPGMEAKKKPKKPLPELEVRDGMIVAAKGMGIWYIDDGVRRHVPDVKTQIAMGIGMHIVVTLHPEQLEAVPEGEPMPRRR